jgi:hypothetical protein
MATVLIQLYGQAIAKVFNKEIDWDTDTIVATLHNNTYVPNRDTHAYVSDLTNELGTALGYTVGGKPITGKTVVVTAANSWTQQWSGTIAYNAGEIRRPTVANGFVYRVAVAGTSSVTQPTWPTVIGQTVVDGGVTWTCVGRNVVSLNGAAINWAAPFDAGPFRHLVISDRTPGTAATQPLVAIVTYAADQTGASGAFDFTPDAAGYVAIPVP